MHPGKKLTGILIAGAIAASGCADPAGLTGPRRPVSEKPAFDGIGWAGSGNRTETDSTASSQSVTTTTTAEAASGLGWAGSGN